MIECVLGKFGLSFEESGKLAALAAPGGRSLLNRSDYRFDLGDGRVFHPGGWDECFPTIEPFGQSPVMGELIGQAPVLARTPDCVEQTWRRPRFDARRLFRPRGQRELEMAFSAVNRSPEPLPFLWASHALFDTGQLRSVLLPDGQLLATFSADGTCRKFFVAAGEPVRLEWSDQALTLQTDQPFWGVWLNRGGWPEASPAGLACIGIEATTTPGEVPGAACLHPGQAFQGKVVVRRD